MMLNIYTLAGKKFLKWTNEDCSEEYYTALENIRTFTRHGEDGLKFIQVGQGYYCYTSYKFSDLEDSVRGYSGDHIYFPTGVPELI
jgi:hypothetical protein